MSPQIHLAREGIITSHNYVRLGYDRMFRGAYGHIGDCSGLDPWDVRRRILLCRSQAAIKAFEHKNAVLYGATALTALGVALPQRLYDWDNCHILIPTTVNQPMRRGIIAHRVRTMPSAGWKPTRLPIIHPVDHWLQMHDATDDEMIEIGDGLVRRKNPLLTMDEMSARLQELAGMPGATRARRLLKWVRPATDSLPETTTRLILVHAGLPEPQVNLEVYCPLADRQYHLDLGYDEEKVGVEYDGTVHVENRRQMEIDALRRRHLQEAGWTIITVTSGQLEFPNEIVRTVESALIVRRGRM